MGIKQTDQSRKGKLEYRDVATAAIGSPISHWSYLNLSKVNLIKVTKHESVVEYGYGFLSRSWSLETFHIK